jgi:hypothetical protein
MRELMIVVAFFGWLFGMQQPMEKQALTIAQRVPVSETDRALPRTSNDTNSSEFRLHRA